MREITDRKLPEHSDSRDSERSNARWNGQMDVVEVDDDHDEHQNHSEIMRDQRFSRLYALCSRSGTSEGFKIIRT